MDFFLKLSKSLCTYYTYYVSFIRLVCMLFYVPLSIVSSRHQYRRSRFRSHSTCHLSPLFPGHFVSLGFIVPLENFWLIWRRQHYRWKGAKFGVCLALIAIDQQWVFSVSHLLWHGISVYHGHLRGPVTLARALGRVAVTLSICFNVEGLSGLGFEHQTFRLRALSSQVKNTDHNMCCRF